VPQVANGGCKEIKKAKEAARKKSIRAQECYCKEDEIKSECIDPSPAGNTPKASEYAVGDQVSHPMFGSGTVAAVDADKLTIQFAKGVTKQIVDYYVRPRKA
jgi:hypothetical protein